MSEKYSVRYCSLSANTAYFQDFKDLVMYLHVMFHGKSISIEFNTNNTHLNED